VIEPVANEMTRVTRSLDHVVSTFDEKPEFQKSNPAAEACLIGVVAHFEAFCKHLFAASANLSAFALRQFSGRRPELAIKLQDLLSLNGPKEFGIGFLVADHFDFGSPEKVNGLFRDLLGITPLSKDDISTYSEILRQRHLIVHHGGIFTLEYCRKTTGSLSAYVDGVRITHEQYAQSADFLFELALKMTRAVANGLRGVTKEEGAPDERRQMAIDALLVGL
jgi:hypothetical protein